ncbi:MAG: putative sugar nucleotidyl transferase [Gemmatimonadota bacterium]
MTPRLYLFDDRTARGWSPFSLTRPAGELLFGALLLRRRIERSLGIPAEGYVATPGIEGFEEAGAPPVFSPEDVPSDCDRVLLSSRYLPPLPTRQSGLGEATPAIPSPFPAEVHRILLGDVLVGWLIPAGLPLPSVESLLGATGDAPPKEPVPPSVTVPGALLETVWEWVEENPARIARDLEALYPAGVGPGVAPFPETPSVHRLGSHAVSVEEGVTIDPLVVLDAREGPIHLAAGVHVHPFTTLRGPAYIGPESILLGGTFESISCGPICRLRGELSASVLLGYVNKAHDGYIGHAILGHWVNLGAFTTNSDLKNNYGPIRIGTSAGESSTGLVKLGVFIGDHAKTGIGTLLNAGTVVGAGTNLFGGSFPWKWIPPFGWGSADAFGPYRLEAFLETAERAMGRRDVSLTLRQREFLTRAWRSVHGTNGGMDVG